ncbi:MAG: AraC family transcriptional regulator [Blautia sp.]|nr:AraC family transcriptional regulator [Blautia sp.]MDD7728798.1 AraC family transcriptional regulator [Clostridia bacterium]
MEFQHELIIPNEGLPFKLFLFEGAGGNYVREKHWHTSVELFAVLDGRLSFFLNEEEYPLEAGELIIINSNEIHSIHAPEKNETVVLQIPLKQFEDYFTAQRFIRFRSAARQGRDRTAKIPDNRKLAFFIEELYKVYTAREVGWEFRTMALYYNILFLLVKDYRESEAAEKEIQDSRRLDALSKITTYMREHYTEDLKLSDLASLFGYSDAYLSRMFKKYAKVNFKSYLQEIRMAYAYRELMNTDYTISRIAMDNGFADSRAFSKEFRKRYGILPSEIKRGEQKK